MDNSRKIAEILSKHRLEVLGYLPCERLRFLVHHLPEEICLWNLTRESAGIALTFGWMLGGRRAGLLIQSTGIGNLITELMTLPVLYRLPLPVLVSWRGHYQEKIEAQTILGERILPMFNALGVAASAIEVEEDLERLDVGIGRCFEEQSVEFFLLSPSLWEKEHEIEDQMTGNPRLNPTRMDVPGYADIPGLTRYEAIKTILEDLDEETVVIAQIGYPAREAYYAKDRPRNFYLLGALGSATLVGIGLAKARPDLEVLVLDGDGSFFLNPNQLLELSQHVVGNLTVVILDNGAWGSTGSQPTLSSCGLDLGALGFSAGTGKWRRVSDAAQWKEASRRREHLIHFLIRSGNAAVGMIPLSAINLKERFLQAIHPSQ